MIKVDRPKDVARNLCANYGITLSADNLSRLADIMEPMKLLRGKTAVIEGEVCKHLFYVTYGLVLQYYKRDDITVTENIVHEGEIITCIESFFKQEPSTMNLITLEPSVLFAIPHEKLFELAGTSFEFCRPIFAIEQRMLIQSQQRACVIRFDSAKERYLRTMKENPEIIRRAPLHHVASLLQITPETLSRVRNQVNMELY